MRKPDTQVPKHYVYVFVREDLSPPQQSVQSIHATIEAIKVFDFDSLPDHPYVVLLAAKNEQRLHRAHEYLVENGVQHACFYESDLGHELTAVATEPICDGERRKLFLKYQLLKGGK